MPNRTRQRFRRQFVFEHSRLGDQPRTAAAPTLDQHLALVANEDESVLRIQGSLVLQLFGAGGEQAAIVPMQRYGWSVIAGRKLEVNGRCQRVGIGENGSGRGMD